VSSVVMANYADIVDEIGRVGQLIDPESGDGFVRAIREANRIFVAGQGRSGLVGRAFAMRLMHLGFAAFAVGEVATPAIGGGDLLVAVSGSGATDTTRRQIEKSAGVGARVALVTAKLEAPEGVLLVQLPIRGFGIRTRQHAGSLFEQSALVLFDAIARTLQDALGLPDATLDARHANLQ